MKNEPDDKLEIIQLGVTNSYLLKLKVGYLVIDTSFPQFFDTFCIELNNRNIQLNEIKYLLLTHHHDDHAGFASKLKESSGCRLIVHKESLLALTEGKIISKNHPLNLRVKILMGIFNKFKKRDYSIVPVKIDNNDIIIDQEIDIATLPSLGVVGKIVHTVGHSIDSISVVLGNGRAFTGDICMNFLNICGINYRPIYLTSMELVLKSWGMLIENGAKEFFPAHGKSFPIERLIKSKNKYEKKFA